MSINVRKLWLGICLAVVVVGLTLAGPAPAQQTQQAQGTAQAQTPQAKPQEPEMKPAIIEQPMQDFSLPTYQGGTVTLSQLKGKNVMIIFVRGYAAPGYWCTICNYRYVELAELEKAQQIRKKYNVEVLVVFPYSREIVQSWLEALPGQLDKIREGKNPTDPTKLDEAGKRRMTRWRQFFPKDFSLSKGEILDPFPVLIDADRAVSKRLGLFQTEWSGSKVDQNIPSVFILDRNGVLLFKYMGQNTTDRPSYDYLFKVLDVVNGLK
ncbi:MAG: redoxin domain-containing protein [Candidatus Aminicenantales bacterium]|jgi:peroxiredoxin